MSRPHICFIQSQCIPWAEPAGSLRWLAAPGVQLKILSEDSDDESVTAVVHVPAGFQRPWLLRAGRYFEVLMLDGDWTLEESGRTSALLGSHGYLSLAASSEQSGQLRSRAGAVALVMTGPAGPEPPIVIEDTYALPWQHGAAGSETGYCLFIRVLGGPLSNQFSAQPAPFSWRPEYRPSLPPHLQAIARAVDGGESW
jgi:hypothetical protein